MAVNPHIMAGLNYMTRPRSRTKLQKSVINPRLETKIKCFFFLFQIASIHSLNFDFRYHTNFDPIFFYFSIAPTDSVIFPTNYAQMIYIKTWYNSVSRFLFYRMVIYDILLNCKKRCLYIFGV